MTIEVEVHVPQAGDAAEREMLVKLFASYTARKATGWTCAGSVVIDGKIHAYADVDSALALFESRLRVLGAA